MFSVCIVLWVTVSLMTKHVSGICSKMEWHHSQLDLGVHLCLWVFVYICMCPCCGMILFVSMLLLCFWLGLFLYFHWCENGDMYGWGVSLQILLGNECLLPSELYVCVCGVCARERARESKHSL